MGQSRAGFLGSPPVWTVSCRIFRGTRGTRTMVVLFRSHQQLRPANPAHHDVTQWMMMSLSCWRLQSDLRVGSGLDSGTGNEFNDIDV